MDLLWRLVFFGFPAAILVAWAVLLLTQRKELRNIAALFTMTLASWCAYRGVWAQFHLAQLQARKGFDYGFEETTWLLSIGGVAAGIVWAILSKTKLSFFSLAISGLMCFVWMTICATF
jgi:NO-binding membrane sensor protein with MHYT domain